MIPKEKAQELFMRNFEITVDDYCAQQCALIAVDEILNLDLHSVGDYKYFDDPSEWYISYWEEVKHEIQQL